MKKIKNVDYRINLLKSLKNSINNHAKEILDALKTDLNKSKNEAFFSEIYTVIEEINLFTKKLKKWAKPQKVSTPFMQFFSKSTIYNEPYGKVLIISPWNYPFQLPLMTLIGAVAAGNSVVMKLSEYSPETSNIVAKIIKETFEEEHVTVKLGDATVAESLLEEKFDYIFYTGNSTIGKKVMLAASKNLTPVTLELGGKSPCIIDESANLDLAAKRIVLGKFLNAGQTCVAPDYILVQKSVKNKIIENFKKCICEFYTTEPLKSDDLPKIINEKHFERLENLIKNSTVIQGGKTNVEDLKIEPTLIDANWDDEIMKDEIFGPLLPIIGYESLDEVILKLKTIAKPLALYCFTQNKTVENKVLKEISFGGGCINETILHLTNPELPFGGVGYSGMGAYHGKYSYETFTHKKSILKKSNLFFFPHYSLMFNKKLDFVKYFFSIMK